MYANKFVSENNLTQDLYGKYYDILAVERTMLSTIDFAALKKKVESIN